MTLSADGVSEEVVGAQKSQHSTPGSKDVKLSVGVRASDGCDAHETSPVDDRLTTGDTNMSVLKEPKCVFVPSSEDRGQEGEDEEEEEEEEVGGGFQKGKGGGSGSSADDRDDSSSGISFTAHSDNSIRCSLSSEDLPVDEHSKLFTKRSSSCSSLSRGASESTTESGYCGGTKLALPAADDNQHPEQPLLLGDAACIQQGSTEHLATSSPAGHYNNGSSLLEVINISSDISLPKKAGWTRTDIRNWSTLIILFITNLLNYMDRLTIAGVLVDVQAFYGVNKADAGLLHTSFICSYMVLSPLFGYLGDRYNRKIIMAVAISFWSSITLASSFIPADKFWLLLTTRALVGVGEASYSTIAPTIIADLFAKETRTKALSVFYFAVLIGSGLGYIVGAKVAEQMGNWQWALRITPGLGMVCVVLLLVVVQEPPRGCSDGGHNLKNTSYLTDLKHLLKNKTFLLSTLGFTCVAFMSGALAIWMPTYIYYSIRVRPSFIEESTVSVIFGVITCVAGFLGVGLGSYVASRLRSRCSRADPLVCAFGLIVGSPFIYLCIFLSKDYVYVTWTLAFVGETLLCMNWALVTDILLYIVIPTRRATAEAVQILISHVLGDAGSPYVVGSIADALTSHRGLMTGKVWRGEDYLGLQYAQYVSCFVAVLGGGFFLWSSFYIDADRDRVDKILHDAIHQNDDEEEEGGSGDSLDGSFAETGGIHVSGSAATTQTMLT